MKCGVRGIVLILALAPAALISASLIAYFATTRIQDMEHALTARGQAIVANLAPASEFGVASRNRAVLEPLARAVLRNADLAQVAILDRERAVLVEKRADPAPWPADEVRWFEAPIRRTLIEVDDLGEPRAVQETRGGEGPAIGVVRVALSRAGTIHRQREVLWIGMTALLVCLGIVSLVGLYIGGQIYRPIRRLSSAFHALSQGRFEIRLPERSPGELGVLEQGFNRTATVLKQSHDHLREQVASATAELRDALRQLENQNAELVVAREKAEAASRAKSQFVATVSHEIRTPLHGIVGFVGLLAKTPLTDRQKTYLALLEQSTDSLLVEINSILDFSQLEAGKMQPRERPFNLKELLETTFQQFDSRARAKGLNLRIAIDPRLPEWVCADRQSLEKILRNLIDNAIKFTSRGKIQVRVWGVRENEHTFECHFAVRDTGIGISPEHRATIFQAFHQIDSSITRQQGGSGLGLSICRQLVELMKGRLTVKSRLGQGSTFYVEMPLTLSEPRPEWIADEEPARPSDAEDGALPALPSPRDEALSPRRPSKTHRLGGARVLVVDDQSQNRVYAQLALLELDAEVVTAASGHEALEACQNQRFDLVLMDVRMPDMDGLEATRRIRQLWNDADSRTPIIGLTADLLNLDRQDWQNAGMDDCQFKPLGVEALNDIFVRWEIGPSARSHSLSRSLRKRYER